MISFLVHAWVIGSILDVLRAMQLCFSFIIYYAGVLLCFHFHETPSGSPAHSWIHWSKREAWFGLLYFALTIYALSWCLDFPLFLRSYLVTYQCTTCHHTSPLDTHFLYHAHHPPLVPTQSPLQYIQRHALFVKPHARWIHLSSHPSPFKSPFSITHTHPPHCPRLHLTLKPTNPFITPLHVPSMHTAIFTPPISVDIFFCLFLSFLFLSLFLGFFSGDARCAVSPEVNARWRPPGASRHHHLSAGCRRHWVSQDEDPVPRLREPLSSSSAAAPPPLPPPLCCMRRVNEALALLTFDVTSSHGHLLSQPFVIVPAVFTGGARFKALEGLVAFPTQRPPRLSSGWR